MLRKLWFQLHWFMGITVGVVLIILGVTGGMLTFEREIIRAINSDVLRVEPLDTQRLSPEALLRQAQEVLPERQINSLSLSSDPQDAATVNVAGDGPQARRGVNHYFNPYNGELIGAELKGQAFFRTLQRLHRWLLMGDVGKQITGAATIMLIILVLSGIYLRWPRSWKALAGWFTFSFRRSGRGFISSMHGVVGTWVLPLYLLAALTGLYWSYDWYRAGLHELSGVPMPVRPGPPQPAQEGNAGARAGGARSGEEAPRGRMGREASSPREPVADRFAQVDRAWRLFEQAAPLGYSTATLRLPQPGGDYQFMYFDPRPAHERAWNRLTLAAGTGEVQSHIRYADRPLNEKLMSSMLPLHSGSFFGMPGRIAMMVASLIMPLFAITGLVLYIDRRRKAQVARSALLQAGLKPTGERGTGEGERIHVVFASQTGNAETQAWKTAGAFQAAGLAVAVHPLGTLTPNDLKDMGRVLFIASTYGEGEPPDPARPFARLMERQHPDLSTMEYALLALGDRGYCHFCAFGRSLDEWLRSCGATAVAPRVEVDSTEPAALGQWQVLLRSLGAAEMDLNGEMSPPAPWTLVERRVLNPGSLGGSTFHLSFRPGEGVDAHWQAGDLVEVHVPAAVTGVHEVTRLYSIASVPAEGCLNLLVRQVHGEDGRLGLGSGYLTATLEPGQSVSLRLRPNRNFRLDQETRPLILIGNGTGLAALRAHLVERITAGHHANWLVFGERQRAHDFYYEDEIRSWQAQGGLVALSLAFSRDGEQREYVQHQLRAHAGDVIRWVDEGAVVLVCGSALTMAPAVDEALREILGEERFETLSTDARYRRDVY